VVGGFDLFPPGLSHVRQAPGRCFFFFFNEKSVKRQNDVGALHSRAFRDKRGKRAYP